MVTFVAEKHENIVAFVLFAVALVRRIESGGARGLSAGGHWAHFDGIEIDIADQAEARGARGIGDAARLRVVGVERSREGVLQQRAHRHGPHSAGDGRDGTGNGGDGVEIDIAHHAKARGA